MEVFEIPDVLTMYIYEIFQILHTSQNVKNWISVFARFRNYPLLFGFIMEMTFLSAGENIFNEIESFW